MQRASGENPWDIPACATIHGNAAEWRCGPVWACETNRARSRQRMYLSERFYGMAMIPNP